jgi:presqualene diphosphate synthase
VSAERAIAERVERAGTSFYWAMRLLPPPRRSAMFAVYAFCREVDDIADEPAAPEEKRRRLDAWRAEVAAVYRGEPSHLVAQALVRPVRDYALREAEFQAVIDGMAMDAERDIRAPSLADLDLYCDRVASAVGRLSTRIFGLDDEPGLALAHHLGRALQLTNILRDLDEDAALGRLYLPREALLAAGIDEARPEATLRHPRLGLACAEVAARAERHFAEADRIMATCPRAAVRAPRLMAAAYGTILRDLQARGWSPPRRRVSTNRLRLAGAVLRYGLV